MGVAVAVDPQDNVYVIGQYTGSLEFGDGRIHHSAGLDDVFLLKLDSRGHPLWSRSFGGTSHDYADDVSIGADGSVYIAGSFMEQISFGGEVHRCKGVHDVFLAKLDAAGEHLWSKAYGDSQDQICLRVEADTNGGVFVTGYFRGVVKLGRKPFRSYPDKAAFVGRLDSDGEHVWSEQYGHIFDYINPDVTQATNGDLIHIGGSDPTREFTGKKMKRTKRMMELGVVLARYRADGERVWRHRFGRGSDNLGTFLSRGRLDVRSVRGRARSLRSARVEPQLRRRQVPVRGRFGGRRSRQRVCHRPVQQRRRGFRRRAARGRRDQRRIHRQAR